jgi:hypothetical protein
MKKSGVAAQALLDTPNAARGVNDANQIVLRCRCSFSPPRPT